MAVMVLLIASVAACQKPARVVPNAAPGLKLPAEDPLGDAAAATRERAITHVARQFGFATVKTLIEQTYLAPFDLQPELIRQYYDRQAQAGGWTLPHPVPGDRTGAGVAIFRYSAPGQGFAVIVQPPLTPRGKRPVTVVTFSTQRR
jgi:hypothetical protein